MLSCFHCVQLCAALWTVDCQAPLSMGFYRQEYWSGLPHPSPGHLPDPGKVLWGPASMLMIKCIHHGLPWWLSSIESTHNPGDAGDFSIPGPRRSSGEGDGNPPQYSCLENPMNREAWQAIVHWAAKSCTWPKQLSMQGHILYLL